MKIVLAQAVRSAPGVADDVQCVVAWLRDGAWQVATESAAFQDTPADCLSATRLDNQWIIGRWTLGGYGDGPHRVNESGVNLYAFVRGELQQVGSAPVERFSVLVAGSYGLVVNGGREGTRNFVWSPDHTRLVPDPRAEAPRVTPPRDAAARR